MLATVGGDAVVARGRRAGDVAQLLFERGGRDDDGLTCDRRCVEGEAA